MIKSGSGNRFRIPREFLSLQNRTNSGTGKYTGKQLCERQPKGIRPGSDRRLPKRDLPGSNLRLYESWLAEAHHTFREASHQVVSLTYASEWVLDNYYIIRQALQQIEEDLPAGYYRQLPKLTSGPLKDYPRIYAIAQAVLSYQHLLLDPIELQTILIQLQDRVSLTMGELWAIPIFLRYGLVEFLSHALVLAIRPSNPPNLPAGSPIAAWNKRSSIGRQ